jgi:hypothetical protein
MQLQWMFDCPSCSTSVAPLNRTVSSPFRYFWPFSCGHRHACTSRYHFSTNGTHHLCINLWCTIFSPARQFKRGFKNFTRNPEFRNLKCVPVVFQGADHGHFALRVGPNLSNVMHGLEVLTITSPYNNPMHRISQLITSSMQNSLFSLHFVDVE